MAKRENVYARTDETYVKTVVLYANASNALFYDAEATNDKVAAADLAELFKKGVTVKSGDDFYKPICCKSTGLIAYDGSTAVTFTGEAAA